MSFSVSYIGTPDKVVEALKSESDRLQGQSKAEFDSILPGLIAITEANRDPGNVLVKLEANGHRSGDSGSCSVAVSQIWGVLV